MCVRTHACACVRACVRGSESVRVRMCARPRVLCVRARVPVCVYVHTHIRMMHMRVRVRVCAYVGVACACECVRVNASGVCVHVQMGDGLRTVWSGEPPLSRCRLRRLPLTTRLLSSGNARCWRESANTPRAQLNSAQARCPLQAAAVGRKRPDSPIAISKRTLAALRAKKGDAT